MAGSREPMIDQENRPTPINFDTPVANVKVGDLVAMLNAQVAEQVKLTPLPELLKPELSKTEKEVLKEQFKPEQFKEVLKGDALKERKPGELKPEKEVNVQDLTEQVATRVVEMLKEQGVIGR